jgi:hypothetical protein
MQNLKLKLKAKIYSKIFYFLLVFLAFEFLFLNLDKAEGSALSLAIDPPIIVINAVPPTTATSSLTIQNKGDTQITLQIELKPFKAKGENGELEYLKETPEIFKNIQILDANVPIKSITLGPKQQKNLNLNIDIPQDANISDYYFSVVFVSIDSAPIKSNTSINQLGIATNVLLTVGAKETPKATLEEFSTKVFFEKGPAPFTIRVKNTSAHFIKPKGKINIKNIFGQSVGKLDLTTVNILTDSIRAIPNDVYIQELRLKDNSNAKADNSLSSQQPIALWKENLLLGIYTATLDISMSDVGPTLTRTVRFFAFPLQILIIIVVIAIVIIVARNRLKLYANKNRT